MESLPELEMNAAAHDRPKSKWKRPVFWSALVLLVAANLYFIALFLLPRWAPAFTVDYIKHPKAMARGVAAQLKQRASSLATKSVLKFGATWSNSTDANPTLLPWAQESLLDLFRRGDKWEKKAVLKICAWYSCTSCLDAISAEMSELDTESKLLALKALGRMRIADALPVIEKQLADSEEELRKAAMTSITVIGLDLGEAGDRTRALDLLRGALKTDPDESLRDYAASCFIMLQRNYWKELAKVPDKDSTFLLHFPSENIRAEFAGILVMEQLRDRLDAGWYPLLNEVFNHDSSEEVRANAALALILAEDLQSDDKLKFIEALCDPKHAPFPLTREKVQKELTELELRSMVIWRVLEKWNPSRYEVEMRRLSNEEGPLIVPSSSKN